jgi:hypothetical protein
MPMIARNPETAALRTPCRTRAVALMLLVLALVLAAAPPAHAQRENNIWYFGRFAGIDFNSGVARPLKDGALNSYEGAAGVSDPKTGLLRFYTDGNTVWNREHRPMPNGSGLNGDSSSTQAAVIVPAPGDSSVYYLFTAAPEEPRPGGSLPRIYNEGYNYSIIDMRLDGGLGDVVVKNSRLYVPGTEKLTAVRHCNGKDFWVITHKWVSDSFYVYLVSDTGVSTVPVISRSGPFLYTHPSGQLQASPNGRLLSMAVVGLDQPDVLFEFDNATGRVGAYYPLMTGLNLYGTCFSPDNSKLYVSEGLADDSTHTLYQFDLSSFRYSDIISSKEIIYRDVSRSAVGDLQLGPDGRIYVARDGDSSLGVIYRPNERGAACGFVPRSFLLTGRRSSLGLPNIVNVDLPIDAGRDTTICAGDTVRLSGSGDGTLTWSPAEGLSCTDCRSPLASPARTTAYVLSRSTAGSCRDTRDTVIVTVDVPTADAGPDTVLCPGETAKLHASGGVRYRWTPRDGLSCDTCAEPTASPAATTTYTLIAYNASGCPAFDSVRVTLFDASSLALSPDTTICAGSAITLHAAGNGALHWGPAVGLSCADCTDPVASPLETTTYTVTLSGPGGCTVSASVKITVRPAPAVTAGDDATICAGGSATLSASGSGPFHWSPAVGLSCIDCATPIATPQVTTTYRVESSSGGCTAVDSTVVTVVPMPVVDAGADATICSGESVALTATADPSAGTPHYRWSPPDGLSCIDCASPAASPVASTLYYVTVENTPGCAAIDSVRVTVLPAIDARISGDTTICAGESAHISVAGGSTVRWTPSTGLDCADCPSAVARPAVTTTYYAEIGNGARCVKLDSVTITVLPRITAHAHVPRDGAVLPGEVARVPVVLDDPLDGAGVNEIEVQLTYRSDLFHLDKVETTGNLLDEWTSTTLTPSAPGVYHAIFTAPAGQFLSGTGPLFTAAFHGYIGPTVGSELGLTLSAGGGRCFDLIPAPGYLRLDSLCGLSFRLIELTSAKYALGAISPNPSGPNPEIRFSIGLEGPTTVAMFDATGARVATLLDGTLAPGSYAITWDTHAAPSGLYYCRMVSGDWSATERLLLVK